MLDEKMINEKNLSHDEIDALRQREFFSFEGIKLNNITNQFKKRRNEDLVVERFPTGWDELDMVLGGGIVAESITGISGSPSVGKSTFALQMGEQFASQGKNVLYFSYEMSSLQVGSKSIARNYFKQNAKNQDTSISGLSLINKLFWDDPSKEMYLTEEQWEMSEKVAESMEQINEHLFFLDCTQQPMSIDAIKQKIKYWCELYNDRPIIMIDYLHMIAPPLDESGRPTLATDKQILDYNMRGIRSIASEFKSPVIFISALKKDDFKTMADMASLSGSSGIPYNCDVIISLQYAALSMEGVKFDLQYEQKLKPRRVEAVITKNRLFVVGDKIKFDYYSKFDYFDDGANKTGFRNKVEVEDNVDVSKMDQIFNAGPASGGSSPNSTPVKNAKGIKLLNDLPDDNDSASGLKVNDAGQVVGSYSEEVIVCDI